MRILAIGAHADDEILGVGGTLLKHRAEGDEIYVSILTRPHGPKWSKSFIKARIGEQKSVDRFLGTTKRFNLNFHTTELNAIPFGEINQAVTDVVDEVKPDVVYTHFEHDLNYDHAVTFQAAMVATRPPKRIQLFCYETISETEWNNKAFVPNHFVDIEKFIEQKIRAFSLYPSEMRKYPHPRSPEGLRILAQKRGLEVCRPFAEAFVMVRNLT